MADPVLTITQPAHGAALTAPVALAATAVGDTAGLYFRWYSSAHAGTATQPEINGGNHAASALSWAVPSLARFGPHAVTLAASDQEGLDLPAIQATTRSVMAGGGPDAPQPCVVQQLSGAAFKVAPPAPLTLSRAAALVQVLAPHGWLKPVAMPITPATPWVANPPGQALCAIELVLRVEPDGPADPAHSAELRFTADALRALTAHHADDQDWLTLVNGPLPAALANGAHRLRLTASAAGQSVAIQRSVTLTA